MREKRTGKTSAKVGTDWRRLGRLTGARIRRAIQADPAARLTDASFWKGAHVIIPKGK